MRRTVIAASIAAALLVGVAPHAAATTQAGCYNDAGTLVAVAPCYIVVNPDGSSDVFTPDAR